MMSHRTKIIITLFMTLLLFNTPMVMAQKGDSDGDGLPDSQDRCPNEAGPRSNNGCPESSSNPDSDGDGLPDSDDGCPNRAGPRTNRGCPENNNNNGNNNDNNDDSSGGSSGGDSSSVPVGDGDGDGVPDGNDACPNEPGNLEFIGCPPESEQPPFQPPILSHDSCFVTAAGDYRSRVRVEPDVNSEHIGYLIQGVVYPAQGMIMSDGEAWVKLAGEFNHLNLEMWGGTDGYVLKDIVLVSNCPPLEPVEVDVVLPALCNITVGFDSPTWSADPQVPSYIYASFWFAASPGTPIPSGTEAWGVIYVAPYITLPDSDNVFAMATDPAILEAAQNAPYAGAFNWPTGAGGILSGGTMLYRLTDGQGGSCGSIISTNVDLPLLSPDFEPDSAVLNLPIDQYACTIITAFDWVFAFNYAPGEVVPVGTNPIAILNGDMEIAGDVNNWSTTTVNYGETQLDYMQYTGWANLPRVSGDCGWVNNPVTVLASNNLRQMGLAIISHHDSKDGGRVDAADFAVWRQNFGSSSAAGQDDNDLLIWNNGDGSDFLEASIGIQFYFSMGSTYPSNEPPASDKGDIMLDVICPDGYITGWVDDGLGEAVIGTVFGWCWETLESEQLPSNADNALDVIVVKEMDRSTSSEQIALNYTKIEFEYNPSDGIVLDLTNTTSDDDDLPLPIPQAGGSTTLEYCFVAETREGIFEEICVEVDIPANCLLTSMEAGVYKIECEDEAIISVNPLFDGMPTLDLQLKTHDGLPIFAGFYLEIEGVAGESE